MDGTHMAISGFDKNKEDDGYASVLEYRKDQLASSHQIKRYFTKLTYITSLIFNKILHELYFWRLAITHPKVIVLGADTMVLDNNSASKREGNEITYKRKKGFQPLHVMGAFLIDVLFRKGSAHSNHGTDYVHRIAAVVKLIRKRYASDVPIVLCSDGGFFDQKAFDVFEHEPGIHYITTGKLYSNVTEYVQDLPTDAFNTNCE
jgi:hypothetical protein